MSTKTKSQKLEEAKKPTRDELLAKCKELAEAPDILKKLEEELQRCGVVGDTRRFLLVYLALLTRWSNDPVNIVIKGDSTAGKSFTVDTALRYVPPRAYERMSGMSAKAILYWKVDLKHKFLCIGEFAGLQSESGNPWLRQLLTEKRLRYVVTGEDASNGREAKIKEVEGPTGVLMTTTEMQLHPEDETRLLSVIIDDDQEQNKAVIKAQATRAMGGSATEPKVEQWHALHDWIEAGPMQVSAPFIQHLPDLVDVSSGRMKRDFPKVLELIKAHALLHQATRARDSAGKIVATIDDYRAVHHLLGDMLAEAQEAAIPEGVDEIVSLVSVLGKEVDHLDGVPQHILVERLGGGDVPPKINKSTVSRRLRAAKDLGLVRMTAPPKPGGQNKWLVDDPRPRERRVLPSSKELEEAMKAANDNAAKKGDGTP